MADYSIKFEIKELWNVLDSVVVAAKKFEFPLSSDLNELLLNVGTACLNIIEMESPNANHYESCLNQIIEVLISDILYQYDKCYGSDDVVKLKKTLEANKRLYSHDSGNGTSRFEVICSNIANYFDACEAYKKMDDKKTLNEKILAVESVKAVFKDLGTFADSMRKVAECDEILNDLKAKKQIIVDKCNKAIKSYETLSIDTKLLPLTEADEKTAIRVFNELVAVKENVSDEFATDIVKYISNISRVFCQNKRKCFDRCTDAESVLLQLASIEKNYNIYTVNGSEEIDNLIDEASIYVMAYECMEKSSSAIATLKTKYINQAKEGFEKVKDFANSRELLAQLSRE